MMSRVKSSSFRVVFLFTTLVLGECFSCESPYAQEVTTLSLKEAIQEGLSRSPSIQKSKAIVEELDWKRAETLGTGFLPKLSISGSHYFTVKYSSTLIAGLGPTPGTFPGFYPNTTLSLDVSIPIFDGFANFRNVQGASLAAEAAKKELARAEFQLKKDIQLAFYQALAAMQLDDVAVENVKTMEDHLRQVSLQRKGGVATKYDVLRVEVQLSDARADEIDAKDNVIISRKKLVQLMGREDDQRVIKGELPEPNRSKVQDLQWSDKAEARDDIQALNLRAEASEKYRNAQRSWFFPSVFVGGQFLFYDQQQVNLASSNVANTGIYPNAYNLGVFLKWNLFDGGASFARMKQAAFQETEALKSAEAAKISVPYDFDYWKRRYLSNSDHYLAKKLDMIRSEESVRLAKEEERVGSRTSTETLDAELDLFRARAGVVSAQVKAAEAQTRLELAIGRDI